MEIRGGSTIWEGLHSPSDLKKKILCFVSHEPGRGSSPALMTMQSNVWLLRSLELMTEMLVATSATSLSHVRAET